LQNLQLEAGHPCREILQRLHLFLEIRHSLLNRSWLHNIAPRSDCLRH
jgi:hypothetical protein